MSDTGRIAHYPTANKSVRIIDCRGDDEATIQRMADRGFDFLGILDDGLIQGCWPYSKLLFAKLAPSTSEGAA